MEIIVSMPDILRILEEKYPNKKITFEQYGTNDCIDPYFVIEDKKG